MGNYTQGYYLSGGHATRTWEIIKWLSKRLKQWEAVIALLGPWMYRDEVSSREGKPIAAHGRPCLLLDSIPTVTHSPWAAGKTRVTHTCFPEMTVSLCPPSSATLLTSRHWHWGPAWVVCVSSFIERMGFLGLSMISHQLLFLVKDTDSQNDCLVLCEYLWFLNRGPKGNRVHDLELRTREIVEQIGLTLTEHLHLSEAFRKRPAGSLQRSVPS